MKRRIQLTVAYDGTRYSGWQQQANAVTVEGMLNEAIEGLTGEKTQVVGASRTDAGVHSLGNVAVFDTNSKIPPEKYKFALNSRLPEDIRVVESKEVPSDFHPRKCNSVKTYEYRIWNNPIENPVKRLYTHFVYEPLDIGQMQEAGQYLVGEHDFQSFASVGNQTEETIRTIHSLEVLTEGFPEPDSRNILLRVRGNGFLYHMVRIIAGTLIDVGRGRIKAGQVKEILEARDRQKAGFTAPAKGLLLAGIHYERELQDCLIVKTEHWSYGIWQKEIPLSGDGWIYLDSCDGPDLERNVVRLAKKVIRDGAEHVRIYFGEGCGQAAGYFHEQRSFEGFSILPASARESEKKDLPEDGAKCFQQAFHCANISEMYWVYVEIG